MRKLLNRLLKLTRWGRLRLTRQFIKRIAECGEGFDSGQDSWHNQVRCASHIFKGCGFKFASHVAGMVRRGMDVKYLVGYARLV